MVDTSAITGVLLDWMLSPLIWIAIVVVVGILGMGVLYIRKKRKMYKDFIEVVDYGSGKAGFNTMKGGYVGKKKAIFGLLDYGDEHLESEYGDIIFNFTDADYQEINGKRGILVARDPNNHKLLVPLSKVHIVNKEIFLDIPPGEYVDAVKELIGDVENETKDRMKEIAQWIIFGGIIIFAILSIIFVTQMISQSQEKASNLIMEAGKTCLENAKQICQEIATTKGGNSP